VVAEQIIYSNPVKNERDVKYAIENKVLLTTADTIDELLKIQKLDEKK